MSTHIVLKAGTLNHLPEVPNHRLVCVLMHSGLFLDKSTRSARSCTVHGGMGCSRTVRAQATKPSSMRQATKPITWGENRRRDSQEGEDAFRREWKPWKRVDMSKAWEKGGNAETAGEQRAILLESALHELEWSTQRLMSGTT